MDLLGLSCENYKPFLGREALEIRPLTVLIGRNSAGKSSLARIPLLLARAFSERAQSPVDLEVDGIDFGDSFEDLIFNRVPHGAITFGVTLGEPDGPPIEVSVRVQYISESMLQVVSEFVLRRLGQDDVQITWQVDSIHPEEHRYRLAVGNRVVKDTRVVFHGLLPVSITANELAPQPALRWLLDKLPEALRSAFSSVGYLGPFREAPLRHYRFPGGSPKGVGPSGKEAPALLGADYLRHRGVVVAAVGDWYREHLGGWQLGVSQSNNLFSLVLRDPNNPNVQVNLADTGTGLSQVLPLVVQRHFESVTGQSGGLEIVEQPELHLHPAAHGDLADLYVDAAKISGTRFLLETHSENFVLRIRRRVAEGSLDRRRVGLYWIDSEPGRGARICPVEILPNGDVATWPKGVFSEDFEEVKAIRAAQRRAAP